MTHRTPPRTGLPRSRQNGFTLIEIVMVLMLTGIIGAVALSKYFDLQHEATERMCSNNRNTVLRSLFYHFANARLSGIDSFESTIDATLETVVRDASKGACTNGGNCPALCPAQEKAGGTFTVRYATGSAGASYQVSCSIHGTLNAGSRTIVNAQNANDVMNELVQDYSKAITDATSAGAIKSIEDFFSVEAGNIIDSEAVGDFTGGGYNYGSYSSITEAVLKELSDRFDFDKVMFRITRSGGCTSGDGCQYAANYQFTVANVENKSALQAGDTVQTYTYTARVYYGKNTGGQANASVVKWDPVTVTTGTAAIGMNQDNKGGPSFKVLQPISSGTH